MWRCHTATRWCVRRCSADEGSSKAIAASRNVDDISGTLGTVAQGFAQSRDVEAKAALVHIDVSPDSLDQFSLVDDFARVFGKDDENVKRTPTNVKSSSILLQ